MQMLYRLYSFFYGSHLRFVVTGGMLGAVMMNLFSARTLNPVTNLIFLTTGFVASHLIYSSTKKQSGHLFVDMDKNRFYKYRKFKKMLKEERLPESKKEQVDYFEYLGALEAVNTKAQQRRYFPIFYILLLLVMTLTDGITLLTALGAPAAGLMLYGLINSKRSLEKIKRLKSNILGANPSLMHQPARDTEAPKRQKKKSHHGFIIIGGVALVLYLFWYIFLPNRFQAWFRSAYPETAAIHTILRAQYPQKRVRFSVRTDHSGSVKQHTLSVGIIDKTHPNSEEKEQIKSLICAALDQNVRKYDKIILQSTIEHRFLTFYMRSNEVDDVECGPAKSEPVPDDYVPSQNVQPHQYAQPQPLDESVPEAQQPNELDARPGFQLRVQ